MEKILSLLLIFFSILHLTESQCECVNENSPNCDRFYNESYYEKDNKICFYLNNGKEYCSCKEGLLFDNE
jgi:hypothetical protein